jgi:hypothetical protein
VRTFPDLDPGEKVLWMESLVEWIELGENSGVTALLRPPLCFGYLTTEPAPKGRRPQVPELRILMQYSLSAYYHAGVHGDVEVQAPAMETRYTLAPESESGAPDGAETPSRRERVTT